MNVGVGKRILCLNQSHMLSKNLDVNDRYSHSIMNSGIERQ